MVRHHEVTIGDSIRCPRRYHRGPKSRVTDSTGCELVVALIRYFCRCVPFGLGTFTQSRFGRNMVHRTSLGLEQTNERLRLKPLYVRKILFFHK